MIKFYKLLSTLAIGLSLMPAFALAATGQDDPQDRNLWYFNTLQVDKVWNYSQGQGIIVAVIDAGVDLDHPDLSNQIYVNQKEIVGDNIDNDHNGYIDDYKGWDFLDDDNDPNPVPIAGCTPATGCDVSAYYHGTAVSGIIAAETGNGFGISGLAPKAKIMPLRVLDSTGSGSSADVIKAVDYAVRNGAKVINMSFVGPSADPALTTAIERAYNAGVAVIIAAGNKEGTKQIDLDASPRYPVCSRGTNGEKISFGVGAHDQNYKLATFSNYGSSCIDLLAPGDDIFALVTNDPAAGFNNFYEPGFRGTSLATPMVSGAVADIRSYNSTLSVPQIFQLLRQYAKNISALNPGFETKIGSGALDILNVMLNISSVPTPPPPSEPPPVPGQTPIDGLNFGDLFKAETISTVYYYGRDGKRYVFPDSGTYFSWYPDFSTVKTITLSTTSQITLGGVVTYRPGARLVKVATDPKVYAVEKGGTLRWVTSEAIAISIYGADWPLKVSDLSDAFVASYKYGSDITSPGDYDAALQLGSVLTINDDKSL